MIWNHVTVTHGILQELTDPSWHEDFELHLARRFSNVRAESESYKAGLIPPWNLWVKNPPIAKALARRSANFHRALTGIGDEVRISIVAHSNGTNISALQAKLLAKKNVRVETLILIGSALASDIDRSGLRRLVRDGFVGRVIAYCSEADWFIDLLEGFPGFYGSLGSRGLRLDGKPVGLQVEGYEPLTFEVWPEKNQTFVTRHFPHFSHGEWFDSEHRNLTFDTLAKDLQLDKYGDAWD